MTLFALGVLVGLLCPILGEAVLALTPLGRRRRFPPMTNAEYYSAKAAIDAERGQRTIRKGYR